MSCFGAARQHIFPADKKEKGRMPVQHPALKPTRNQPEMRCGRLNLLLGINEIVNH